MLLAFERSAQPEIYAYDLEPRPTAIQPPATFDGDRQVRVTALLVQEPLEDLGLAEGLVSPSPAPSRPLGELTADRYEATLGEGTLSDWTPASGTSTALLSFPLPDDADQPRCPTFEQTILMDEPFGCCTVAVGLEDGTVLVGRNGHIVHLDTDGSVLGMVEIPDAYSGARGPSGVFVLGTEKLYRVSLDPLGFEAIAEGPGIEDPRWGSAGENDQIFLLNSLGDFSFFDGSAWRKITTFDIQSSTLGKGGALWLADRHGAAVLPSHGTIQRWDGVELHQDVVSPQEISFGAATTTARYGPIATGTRYGEVFQFTPEGWERLPFELPPRVQTVTQYRDGIAYGTESGLAGYAAPITTGLDCQPVQVREMSEVFEILPLGEALLVGGVDRNNRFRWVALRDAGP